MKAKEKISSEKIVKAAEEALIKKLSDRIKVVEIITEERSGGYEKTVKKEKLIKADLNAIIFALKAHNGEKWNSDEKEMNKAKIAKLQAESGKLNDLSERELSEKLMDYVSEQPENL